MLKILTGLPVTLQQREKLLAACEGCKMSFKPLEEIKAEDVCDADAIIGNVSPELLQSAVRLRWLQLNSAGTDAYTKPGILGEGVQLTNAVGAYGLVVAEYMVAAVLSIAKRLHTYRDHMHTGLWRDEGPVMSIAGSKTLVLGTGDIGTEFAKRMDALGSTVWGIRRRAEEKKAPFEKLYSMEDLERLLPQADIVAVALPGLPELDRFFDRTKFAAMKNEAILINAGRGNLIDQEALLEFLDQRAVFGAALDVTEPEPLPADSPLWDCPKLLITPHIAGGYHLPCVLENIVDLSAANIRRFTKGGTLLNRVQAR